MPQNFPFSLQGHHPHSTLPAQSSEFADLFGVNDSARLSAAPPAVPGAQSSGSSSAAVPCNANMAIFMNSVAPGNFSLSSTRVSLLSNPDPWNPLLAVSMQGSASLSKGVGNYSQSQTYQLNNVSHFRDPVPTPSESSVVSHGDHGVLSDSGYVSMNNRRSVGNRSLYNEDPNLETQSLISHFQSRLSRAFSELESRSQGNQIQNAAPTKKISCEFPGCKFICRTRSEFKKHKARHERPWKCPDPDCKKHMCGFSTRNDLDRHLKSVHKMVTPNTKTTMYRCPFGQCKDIQKDWPRKDNFIQHLKRVHHLSEPIDVNHFSHQVAASPAPEDLAGLGSQPLTVGQDGKVQPHSQWPGLPADSSIHLAYMNRDDVDPRGYAQDVQEEQLLPIPQSLVLDSMASTTGVQLQAQDVFQGIRLKSSISESHHAAIEPSGDGLHQPDPVIELNSHDYGLSQDVQPQCDQVSASQNPPLNPSDNSLQIEIVVDDSSPSNMCDPPGVAHIDTPRASPSITQPLPTGQDSSDLADPINCLPSDLLLRSPAQESMTRSPRVEELCQGYTSSENQDVVRVADQSSGHDLDMGRESSSEDGSEGSDAAEDRLDGLDVGQAASIHTDEGAAQTRLQGSSPSKGNESTPNTTLQTDPVNEAQASEFLKALMRQGILDKLLTDIGYHGTRESQPAGQEPATQVSTPSSITAPRSEGKHACKTCKKYFNRRCELKKHMKRHDKPYACTFPRCIQSFGSKNDWKRHENTVHSKLQLEVWQCTEPDLPPHNAARCARMYYRRESLKSHMEKDHGIIDNDLIEKKLTDYRHRGNFESRFWCGFCRKIIEPSENNGKPELLERSRFDHIDQHFNAKNGFPKANIKEWKYLDDSKFLEDSLGGVAPDSERLAHSGKRPISSQDERVTNISSFDTNGIFNHNNGIGSSWISQVNNNGQRDNNSDSYTKKSGREYRFWVCCGCGFVNTIETAVVCVNCNHTLCQNCTKSRYKVTERSGDITMTG